MYLFFPNGSQELSDDACYLSANDVTSVLFNVQYINHFDYKVNVQGKKMGQVASVKTTQEDKTNGQRRY